MFIFVPPVIRSMDTVRRNPVHVESVGVKCGVVMI